jgi:hypothetical protein
MKLSEIFSQLTSGEFSQLAVGGAKKGGIAEADHHKVLDNVNLGLMDLHSRFTIRKGRLVLALQPGKQSYSLTKAFAETNLRSRELVRYIKDSDQGGTGADRSRLRVPPEYRWKFSVDPHAKRYNPASAEDYGGG